MDTKLMRITLLVTGTLALSLTASCASGPEVTAEPDPGQRVCINSNSIRNYDVLADKYIYVREGRDKHFLITMQNRCINLDQAYTIAFSDTTSRICSRGFGKILYGDQLSGRDIESCRIDRIERVDDKEHAKRLADALTGPPPDEQGTWTDLPASDDADVPEPDDPAK